MVKTRIVSLKLKPAIELREIIYEEAVQLHIQLQYK